MIRALFPPCRGHASKRWPDAVFVVTAVALLLGGSGQLLAQPRYSIKQESTGSSINRDIGFAIDSSFDKPYAALTEDERNRLKAQYEQMGAGDEPPYPVNGMQGLYKVIAAAQRSLRVRGSLTLVVDVDEQGTARSVSMLRSPDSRMTQFAASALMLEKYKPALCSGAPYAMRFPFRVEFKTE